MKEVVRKEIIHDLDEAYKILKVKEAKDFEELKVLSDHAIENIALYKDLELVSVTVLIYSLYKLVEKFNEEDYKVLVRDLNMAKNALQVKNFGKYNSAIKSLYKQVKKSNARVKEHLQDVMDAARIKKGTSLIQSGLSLGQAAGLMGLSNWDLQAYASKSVIGEHTETIPANKRLLMAIKLFS